MKKMKKMLMVLVLCSIGAIAQHSGFNTSKIYAGIAYAGNVNRNQGAILAAADGVSQVGLYFALAGTGATAGASLIVGLAVSA
jgi:hypothetical protein